MAKHTRKGKTPGLSPGVLILTGEALPPRIHAIRYAEGFIEEKDLASAQECSAFASAEGIAWIDVQGLGDLDLIKQLGDLFQVHPLALEDIVSVGQRPKVDDYDTHLYVITLMAEPGETIGTDQTSLVIGRSFLLSFQEHYGDCLQPVRERLRRGKGLMRRSGPDYLAYAILDAVIDGHFPILESYGEVLESLENEVVGHPDKSSLKKIHRARRDLLTLRRSIWPMRDAINSLLRDETDLITAPTRLYLRDCHDHAVQILDMVETYRELAAGLMEIYISSLSQKLNEVMKVLTIIATIFIPLTFVVGIYGMNFEHMPELNWRYGYPAVMGLMAAGAAGMFWYFLRKGWIGPEDLPASHWLARRRTGRGARRPETQARGVRGADPERRPGGPSRTPH